MAQQTFNNLELRSSVRSKLNGNATDAESRLAALEAGGGGGGGGGSLESVSGADANTTMQAGKRYLVNMSAWATASRNYTIPAGTVGDEIEVAIAAGSGSATFELVLLGASGVAVTLDGETFTATEATRLFCSGESIRFYCEATNKWVVSQDNRTCEFAQAYGTATTAYVGSAYTRFVFGAVVDPHGITVDLVDGVNTKAFKPRRAGVYMATLRNHFRISGGAQRHLILSAKNNGTAIDFTEAERTLLQTSSSDEAFDAPTMITRWTAANIGDSYITAWYYTDGTSGINQYWTEQAARPQMTIKRLR